MLDYATRIVAGDNRELTKQKTARTGEDGFHQPGHGPDPGGSPTSTTRICGACKGTFDPAYLSLALYMQPMRMRVRTHTAQSTAPQLRHLLISQDMMVQPRSPTHHLPQIGGK